MRTTVLAGALLTAGICACSASQRTPEVQTPPVRQGYVMQLQAVGIGDRDGLLLPMVYNLSPIIPGPTPYDGTDPPVADALEVVRTDAGLALLGNRLARAEVVGPETYRRSEKVWTPAYEALDKCPAQEGEFAQLQPFGINRSNFETYGLVCHNNLTVFTAAGARDCTPKSGVLADPTKLRLMEYIHYDLTTQRVLLQGKYGFGVQGLKEVDCTNGASSPLTGVVDGVDLTQIDPLGDACMMDGIGRVLFFGYSPTGGDTTTVHYMAYATETRQLVDLLPPMVGQEQLSCETGIAAAANLRNDDKSNFVFPYVYDIVAVDVRQALTTGEAKPHRWTMTLSEYAEGEAFSYQLKPETGEAVEYHSTFFASTPLREQMRKR